MLLSGGVLWKGALKNFVKFTGKSMWQSLFLIKLLVSGLQLHYKRDSGTGIFLWNLQIFKITFFNRTTHLAASKFVKSRLQLVSLITHDDELCRHVVSRRYNKKSYCYMIYIITTMVWGFMETKRPIEYR